MEKRVVKDTNRDSSATNTTYTITDTKLYVTVVTLPAPDDNKLLWQLKTGFKRTIKWNKYRSKITNQTKTYKLNYLVDPAFSKVNRLSVLSFENEGDRTSYFKCYTPTVEIKDYHVAIDGKNFFDIPIKNKEQTYENPDLKQQINFIDKPEDDNATMFFIIEKTDETNFIFSQNSVTII